MRELAIIDTGFVLALFDSDDPHYDNAWGLIEDAQWDFIISPAVFVEAFHTNIRRALSPHQSEEYVIRAFAQALRWLVRDAPFKQEEMTSSDYTRVAELLEQYAGSGIDYVDAVVVALAERFGTQYVMTVDERDFRMYRPNLSFSDHFILPMLNG